ncbi:hypothetical protein F8388_010262 [Cannabis sativa]|uniref:A20-type domain-containing protein n=1 Tax=Cannabis sativa TaxID=3483 RepID=A0A7J6GRX6_CANSA|nr:hypothetical protein G4B88_001477 [Cannabis sativa]KAF4385706.1 hypothetical protein F8388_010262 [Cannabis sativa]
MDMDDAFNLCVKGCGFYGRVENRNMCSKCYKDFIMEEIICKSLSNIHLSNNITSITTPTFNTTDENDAITNSLCDQFNDLKITKNRCKDCNKKVGLTGFSCRCVCDILDTQNNILPPFKCFLTSDARLSMAASRHCMTRSRSASELIGSPSTCRI